MEAFDVPFQKIILFETKRNKVDLLQNKNPLHKQGIGLEMLLYCLENRFSVYGSTVFQCDF